jgi:hypothetical protein
MKQPEAIQHKLREMLVETIEVQAAKYDEEEWRTGVPGAILQGRINVLEEILDWIEDKSP